MNCVTRGLAVRRVALRISAKAISDQGQSVGEGRHTHAFLLTLVPRPTVASEGMMMLNRYREYVRSHLIEGWAIQMAVVLAFTRVLTWVWPDKSGSSMFLILICVAFTQPSFHLMVRLMEEERRERTLPPPQEQAIARLALASSLCAIGALAVGIYGRWVGWPQDVRVDWLVASFIAATVAALMGGGIRRTQAGLSGMRLSVGWLLLLLAYVCVMLLRRAAGHA